MQLAYKKEIEKDVNAAIAEVTALLQKIGFGVLTRIDFHEKVKEKLGKDIPPTVVLGACNAQLAYEIFSKNPDVTALMPCNAVIRSIGGGKVSVELARPTVMVDFLQDPKLKGLADEADRQLKSILEELK